METVDIGDLLHTHIFYVVNFLKVSTKADIIGSGTAEIPWKFLHGQFIVHSFPFLYTHLLFLLGALEGCL